MMVILGGCATSERFRTHSAAAARAGAPVSLVQSMESGRRLEPSDVISLSRAGVADEVILNYLKRQRGIYLLQEREISYLTENGVSQSVVDYMASTPKRINPRMYPKGYVPCDVCRPAYVRMYGK